MDFGAARDYTEFGEKSLSIVLKPGYAPPEQYQTHGIQGPWTDIYALCATMYKCITGENPPDAIERVMDDSLKKISEFGIVIPPQEEAAIIKGMSVSAKDRYQDIKDLCEDLYGGYEVYIAISVVQLFLLLLSRCQFQSLFRSLYSQTQMFLHNRHTVSMYSFSE